MELDERKVTILKAIIKNYMDTGEPVGSRTISKYIDSKWSSATIRNEMSDLEEMGYIIQPHTSAGRIPSDKGYRFYVDQILQEKDSEVTEIQELMIQRVDRLELVLKQLAKLLAKDTNYAALISGPQYHRNKLKFIQLSKVDVHKLLIVTVVEGNLIKNSIVNIQEEISDEELLNLNILLNSSLNGLTIEEISLGVISRMKEQAGPHSQVVDLVLNEVADAIDREVKRIVDECYAKAKEIIRQHDYVLHACAKLLIEKEKIGQEEFEHLFEQEKERAGISAGSL